MTRPVIYRLDEYLIDLARSRGLVVDDGMTLADLLAALDPESPVPAAAILAAGDVLAELFRYDRMQATASPADGADANHQADKWF